MCILEYMPSIRQVLFKTISMCIDVKKSTISTTVYQLIREQHSCTSPHIRPPSYISQSPVTQVLLEPFCHWLISLLPEASE